MRLLREPDAGKAFNPHPLQAAANLGPELLLPHLQAAAHNDSESESCRNGLQGESLKSTPTGLKDAPQVFDKLPHPQTKTDGS